MKQFDFYKKSGEEWIGEIPKDWKYIKLKHILKFKTGFTPPTNKTEFYENGDINWLTISDLTEKYVSDSNQKITQKAIDDLKPEIVNKGSLLYSFKLSVGRVAFANNDVYTNEAIFSIMPNPSYNLNFFYYSLPNQIIKNSSINIYGATILNQELIRNSYLIIPPLSQQIDIANYLENKINKINGIIKKKEKLISLLDEERKAIINQAITKGLNPNVKLKDSGVEWLGEIPEHWIIKKLKYLAEIKTGGKDTENKDDEGKYPFFVRSQTIERISTYSFDGEAILTAGDGVGVAKVFHYINGKFDYHQRVYRISDFKEIRGKFLFYYIKENLIFEVLRQNAKSTVDSLRMPMFQNFSVAFGNSEEQDAIIKYIENQETRIHNIKNRINSEITLLKEYKQSIIFEAVTGKIDVRETKNV